MKLTLFIAVFLISLNAFCQEKPFSETFETDSSYVEIIRNSLYKCWHETYKYKDSVRFMTWFIDDTTQINYEQWKRKSDDTFFGISREYQKDGTLMYEWDHDKDSLKVNKVYYPYFDMLEEMRMKADSMIMRTYSKDFFTHYVQFEYEGSAWHGEWEVRNNDSVWSTRFIGNWIDPLKQKPNHFRLVYRVRLSKSDGKGTELGIEMDSLGNYVPSDDDRWGNYGFEEVKVEPRTFTIDKNKAIETAQSKGLVVNDSTEIHEFLFWEKSGERAFYNGKYR